MKYRPFLLTILLFALPVMPSKAEDGTWLARIFERDVAPQLSPPREVQARYARLAESGLAIAGVPILTSQYLMVLDRNPHVQAILIYWVDASQQVDRLHFIGAAPVSTGKPGRFDHFITPLGVFPHTLYNMDYRSEGTPNRLGIRGLGRKGMRVFDFGWVEGERGWGQGGESLMRLQMHATDPDYLEPRLGEIDSQGCIRIPATLDRFIDRYGILDEDYDEAIARGKRLWVIRPGRTRTPWPGRYLVIVDSGSTKRPAWSPDPLARESAASREARAKTQPLPPG